MTVLLVGGPADSRTLEVSKDIGFIDVPVNMENGSRQRYQRTERVGEDGAVIFEPETPKSAENGTVPPEVEKEKIKRLLYNLIDRVDKL